MGMKTTLVPKMLHSQHTMIYISDEDNMRFQVLVSTMNQPDHCLVEKMKLNSDAIIINQCNQLAVDCQEHNGFLIHWYSFNERGIGLSRNNALMRAEADIVLFADDDVTYAENYRKIILEEFRNFPGADVIVFNVPSTNVERPEFIDHRVHRLHWYNCLRYGAFRIAVRLDKVRKKNILFHQMFGGGARYGCGEDSIFLADCLKNGLKLYASPKTIGHVSHGESSWFTGYDKKYFWDKGALFTCICEHLAMPLAFQYCFRHREVLDQLSMREAMYWMYQGSRDFKQAETNRRGGN